MKPHKAHGRVIRTVSVDGDDYRVQGFGPFPIPHAGMNLNYRIKVERKEDGGDKRELFLLDNYGDEGAHAILPELCIALCGAKRPSHVQLAICLKTGKFYFAGYARQGCDDDEVILFLYPPCQYSRDSCDLKVPKRVIRALGKKNGHNGLSDTKRPYRIEFSGTTIAQLMARDIGYPEAASTFSVFLRHSGAAKGEEFHRYADNQTEDDK